MVEEIEIQLGDLGSQIGHVFWSIDPRDNSVRITEVCLWFGAVKVNCKNSLTESAINSLLEEIEDRRNAELPRAASGDRDWS